MKQQSVLATDDSAQDETSEVSPLPRSYMTYRGQYTDLHGDRLGDKKTL